MAATIPSLRPFIKTLATNYGANPGNAYGSGSGGNPYATVSDVYTGSNSYQMSSLRPKGKGDDYKYRIWSAKNSVANKSSTGGERSTSNHRNKSGVGADAVSVESSDSQKMIIKKDTTWEVVADS